MDTFIKALQNMPVIDTGEDPIDTALDLLYTAYTEKCPIDSQFMRRNFAILDQHMASLPLETQNAIFQIFCDIYRDNERIAFQKGIQVGARLAVELSQ